jgi:NTE family protein
MELAVSPLFAGLATRTLNEILGRMRPRHYTAGQPICREGDVSDCLYLIESGVVEVVVGNGSAATAVARLRRGDIFGEMGLLTEEPRSATILPTVPVQVLELDRTSFAEIIDLYPATLLNISRVLVKRQKQSLRYLGQSRRGEFILLLIGRGTEALAHDIIASCQRNALHGMVVVDLSASLRLDKVVLPDQAAASVIALLDGWEGPPAAFICVSYCDQPDIASLIQYVDRVALLGTQADMHEAANACAEWHGSVDVFHVGAAGFDGMPDTDGFRTVRTLHRDDAADTGWIARHLTRTKLGLALGAGGAKGFAHVGVIDALQRAGHVIDYVAGSSIGALAGALMGMRTNASEVERQLKQIWSPDNVDLLPTLSSDGVSVGLERVLEAVDDNFGGRSLTDLSLPVSVVVADLDAGEPISLRDWPVHQAIRAGLAIPGLTPPYRHGSRRLVDAVCLTPVPARIVRDMGADIVVSVNLLSRQTRAAWPGEAPPMPARRSKRSENLDPVVETLMMLQVDASIRSAAEADVVLTPCFVPSSWRDFHLAEPFREAGREAAEFQLSCFANWPERLHS